MDPTTLVTFLFRAPTEARTVELLGSWDCFTQPYRMHNDRRRGIWSGIFKFENISFDGNGVQWTKPRSGGKQNGKTTCPQTCCLRNLGQMLTSRRSPTRCNLLVLLSIELLRRHLR